MKSHTRALVTIGAMLALGIWFLASADGAGADDKGALADIKKAAMEFEKGNADAGKKAADEIAKKYELDEVMHSFGLRTKKGMGLGDKPGAILPDGIEAKFINLGKKAPTKGALDKESDALTRAAHVSTVLGHIAVLKAPLKKEGTKDPKDWIKWSKDMIESSEELAKAAKAKDPAAVKKAATSLNSSCNNCHGVFRE